MQAENEHEFELVLGNKQLLGLLFVTFVLLGVFFALGYAMGRTSAPSLVVASSGSTPTGNTSSGGKPPTIDGPVNTPPPTPGPTAGGGTQPLPLEPTPPAVRVLDPKPGETYLQVTAVKRPEAELLVEVLGRKGFKAGITPAPIEGSFRVLVGPVADADQGKLKSELEQAGFKPIPRRY